MQWLKRYWKSIPEPIRKFFVFIIGWAIVIGGVTLLVLPGPGWATIFLGFAILATEFTSAKRVHKWLVGKLRALIHWCKRLWHQVRKTP